MAALKVISVKKEAIRMDCGAGRGSSQSTKGGNAPMTMVLKPESDTREKTTV